MRYTVVLAKGDEAYIWCYASTDASLEAAKAYAAQRGFTVHLFPKQTVDAVERVLQGVNA